MTDNNIEKKHQRAEEMLNALRVHDAISILEEMGRDVNAHKEMDRLSKVKETYGFMTYYMAQGMADANRERMHKDIIETLRSLNDAILRLHHSISEPDYYSSQLRIANLRKLSISQLLKDYISALAESSLAELANNGDTAPRAKKEAKLDELFSVVYTSMGERKEYAEIVRHIVEDLADDEFNMTMIGALTLGLLTYYDRSKFISLLDVYEKSADNQRVASRALVGIVLVLAKYPKRISEDNEIMARLSLWEDSLDTYRNLRETIKAIISTRDTDRIASKMKDEVIPELMKIRPEMLKKMGEMQSDPEAMFSENNPEWEEMLDKSGLAKKMQELGEMSQDGGDLMMLTFSNLKQFPFFSKASNWFLPFSMSNTALSGLSEELHTIIERLDEMSGNVCHSDMYSLALAFNQMPKMQRDMISGQFSQQLADMEEHAKDMQYKSSMPEFDKEVVKYVRDLYRFFKLFRNASEFYNPFKDPIDFISLPAIGNMMVEEEILRLFGEFYFKRGYYKEALPIFEKLVATVHDDYGIYEKIGFCHQQLKEYRRAMDAYSKAELLHTPSQWLIRKIAVVSKRLGNYDKASEYYAKALENEPENTSLILSAGHTELEQGNIAGALVHYYHANYLQQDDIKIIRALGWLELLNGNFDKSADFYAKLSDESATASDHLNRGHALQLAGKIKEAVAEYRKSASIDRDGFCMAYEADLTVLEPLGLNLRDAHILLDAVLAG